jgi:polysaccharide biosynthesis protein PslH
MRILFLSIVDPAVQKGGAWTTSRGLIRLLQEGPLAADVEVLACQNYSGFFQRKRQASAVVRSLFSPLPAKIEFTRTSGMLAKLRQLLATQKFGLIILNGTDLLWMLPHLPSGIPRVLFAHNIESELFASQAASRAFSLPLIRSVVDRESRRLRAYEIEGLRQVGRVVFVSTADECFARAQCPGIATMTIPPVFWTPFSRRPCPAEKLGCAKSTDINIGLLANFHWWPNQRGLAWFLRDVFPNVPSHLRLHLFGCGSESMARAHPRTVPHGFVGDLSEVWKTCDFMICPIFSGGGVCVKAAEALYHGMPLLATTKSVRGLPLEPHPGIALLDTAGAWVEFLRRDALALARQCIPASLSARFSAEHYTQSLCDFLS